MSYHQSMKLSARLQNAGLIILKWPYVDVSTRTGRKNRNPDSRFNFHPQNAYVQVSGFGLTLV